MSSVAAGSDRSKWTRFAGSSLASQPTVEPFSLFAETLPLRIPPWKAINSRVFHVRGENRLPPIYCRRLLLPRNRYARINITGARHVSPDSGFETFFFGEREKDKSHEHICVCVCVCVCVCECAFCGQRVTVSPRRKYTLPIVNVI